MPRRVPLSRTRPQGKRGRRRSRQISLPCAAAAESGARARNLGRIDPGAFGKRNKETLVRKHMLQDAAEKALLLRGSADLTRFQAGRGKESSHSFRIFGNKAKCLNGKRFLCFTRGR